MRVRNPRLLLLALLPAILLPAAAPFVLVRVPGDHVGLSAASGDPGGGWVVLAPGIHLSPFWRRPLVVESGPARVDGRAWMVTPEGASVEVEYGLEASLDASDGARLPAEAWEGSGAPDLSEILTGLAQKALADHAGPADPAERLRRGLARDGVRLASVRASAGSAPGPAPAGARRRLPHPIVLVGLDGADWQILDPLMAAGRLPHLARLRSRSAWGHLRSFEPILSPLLWTTAVTGRSPDEHGIIDFLVPDPVTGRKLPITSRSRRVKALWNIFSERGLTSDVVAWWATWPAEQIHGRIVSDRVAYSLFDVESASAGLASPEGLWEQLAPGTFSDASIDFASVARFLDIPEREFQAARSRAASDPSSAYREPINHLAKILASTRTYHGLARRLLRDGQPDLLAVYYQGIDEVSHRFAHYMPPRLPFVPQDDFRRYQRAVEEFCVYQDELLGDLIGAISPESYLIVLSDHGFLSGDARPTDGGADIEGKPGRWHRLYGIVLASGPGIEPRRLDSATLFDIAPTVLAMARLPRAADMRGAPLVAPAGAPAETIASYESEPESPAARAGADPGPAGSPADEELLRNLASLGYISGAAPSPPPAAAALSTPSPGSVTSHTNLAALLAARGDVQGAESEARRALAIRASYFPALMILSQALVRQGRAAEALEATRRAVAGSPDAEPGAYVQLAMLAARQGETPQAINFLESLRPRRPGRAGIDTALGILAMRAGDRQGAEKRLRAALALDPAGVEPMTSLFQIYRAEGRETELEPAIRQALVANDASVMHHNWMGLILEKRGDAPGAERHLRRALELAPDFGGTMANLGSFYGRQGRLDESVEVLARALRIEPRNLEARVNLGAALAKLGRLDDAVASLQEARRLGMRSPELLNALGLALAQAGRRRDAIEALGESLSVSPDQPRVRSLLEELTAPPI